MEDEPRSAAVRTWRDVLAESIAILGSATDARRLVEEAAGYEPAELIVHLDEPITARCGAYLSGMVERRLNGEPLQYVLGRWGFRKLDLMVDRRVLIPRPETEEVVGWAMAAVERPPDRRLLAVDLGTGSGAIGLSLASELGALVWATDISPDALDVARANLAGVGMWAGTRVRLAEGYWWSALPDELQGQVDLVVCNPPYVRDDEELPDVVGRYEPALALRGGPEGLDGIAEVIAGAPRWLAPGGVLVIELAPGQGAAAEGMAHEACAVETRVRTDILARERALIARW
jgi:release factor glutamine methyltransferase